MKILKTHFLVNFREDSTLRNYFLKNSVDDSVGRIIEI